MLLLILESLGSTELFFILIMALVFFGPRKLPQLSRSLGKHVAEFRRVSEDFKSTWEREVALEDVQAGPTKSVEESNSIRNPLVTAPENEIVARGSSEAEPSDVAQQDSIPDEAPVAEAPRKQDWL